MWPRRRPGGPLMQDRLRGPRRATLRAPRRMVKTQIGADRVAHGQGPRWASIRWRAFSPQSMRLSAANAPWRRIGDVSAPSSARLWARAATRLPCGTGSCFETSACTFTTEHLSKFVSLKEPAALDNCIARLGAERYPDRIATAVIRLPARLPIQNYIGSAENRNYRYQ